VCAHTQTTRPTWSVKSSRLLRSMTLRLPKLRYEHVIVCVCVCCVCVLCVCVLCVFVRACVRACVCWAALREWVGGSECARPRHGMRQSCSRTPLVTNKSSKRMLVQTVTPNPDPHELQGDSCSVLYAGMRCDVQEACARQDHDIQHLSHTAASTSNASNPNEMTVHTLNPSSQTRRYQAWRQPEPGIRNPKPETQNPNPQAGAASDEEGGGEEEEEQGVAEAEGGDAHDADGHSGRGSRSADEGGGDEEGGESGEAEDEYGEEEEGEDGEDSEGEESEEGDAGSGEDE
jgi:hypothetical protein